MPVPLRLVSIGAHPADVFDQSGGTLAHHQARGDYVACVSLTHGARVHDAVVSDAMFHCAEVPAADDLRQLLAERSDAKAQEVQAACRILGVEDVYFMGADDAVLLVERETSPPRRRWTTGGGASLRAHCIHLRRGVLSHLDRYGAPDADDRVG